MAAGLACAVSMATCSPALDWREVRPAGSRVSALFPCKPSSHARSVALAGPAVEFSLYTCNAAGTTFALAFADVVDPSRVTPALEALARAAQANVGATSAPEALPAQVPGMTPNPHARRLQFLGRLPDGRAVHQTLIVFAYGTQVTQATTIAEHPDAATEEAFFGALQVRP